MCSVCLPRLQQHCRDYCASRKRQKRKCVRFAKTIDVISLSAACSDGAEVIIFLIDGSTKKPSALSLHRSIISLHIHHICIQMFHQGIHPCISSRLKE